MKSGAGYQSGASSGQLSGVVVNSLRDYVVYTMLTRHNKVSYCLAE
jgi:hypothetical protein